MSIAFTTNIAPSRILRRISLGFFAIASFSLMYVVLFVDGSLALPVLGVVFLMTLGNAWLLHRFWRAQLVYQLQVSEAGDLVLRRLGVSFEIIDTWQVELKAAALCSSFLTIFCLREIESNKERRLLVCVDSLSGDAYRQLGIALRWLESKSAGKKKAQGELADGNF